MSINKKNSDGSYSQFAGMPYVTKDNIGLSKVENKNSEDIRGEITSKNIKDALGYTPANDVDEKKSQNDIAVLSSRMDGFTKLGEGSTTGDAELEDIRVAYDGKTYSNAGTAVRSQVTELKETIAEINAELFELNSTNVLKEMTKSSKTVGGLTFTWDENKCTISGKKTGAAFNNLYADTTHLPKNIHAGDDVYLSFESTSANICIQIFFYDSNGSNTSIDVLQSSTITVPSDTIGLIARIYAIAETGTTINAVISDIKFLNALSNNQLAEKMAKSSNRVDEIENLNCANVLAEMRKSNTTNGGITFEWNGNNCKLSGSRTALAVYSLYNNSKKMPENIKSGDEVYITFDVDNPNVYLQAFFYASDGSNTQKDILKSNDIVIPDNTVGMILRICVNTPLNQDIDETIRNIKVTNTLSNAELNDKIDGSYTNGLYTSQEYLPSCDLNTLVDTKSYMLIDTNSYDNLPNGKDAGVLNVYKYNKIVFQEFTSLSKKDHYKRWMTASGNWKDWMQNSGADQPVYNVTQTFNEYSNTYNVTSTPTITPDSDYVLNSTNDTTDRTSDIITMLNQLGICRLGVGVFYVNGVDMPSDTMIIGSGAQTKVILLGDDSTEGYAIRMNSRCTVQDMAIMGSTVDYTDNSSAYPADTDYVNRHGILWQGNASGANNNIPRRGIISRCYISNFSGGGITCYDSGLNVISGINVSDCWIWHCYAGINIQFYSEFSRWTNVSCNTCHYGAIDNGGNQTFANCSFSKNIVGMMIDNSMSQSTNNSHGSVCNCVIDHSDENVGVGIKLLGVSNGELFSNIQLFYSSIEIDRCKGISLSNFDFGRSKSDGRSGTVKITNNSFVIMDKFICRESPVISVDGTSKLIMTDCYTWTGEKIEN